MGRSCFTSSGASVEVPLPLLKQPEEPLPATPRLAQRPFFAGFVGGKNAPAVRTQMCRLESIGMWDMDHLPRMWGL